MIIYIFDSPPPEAEESKLNLLIVIDKRQIILYNNIKGTSKNPFERKRASRAEYFVKPPHLASARLRSLSSSSTRLTHFLFSKRFLEVPLMISCRSEEMILSGRFIDKYRSGGKYD